MKVRFTDEAKAKLRARAEAVAGFPRAGRKVREFERDDLREVHEAPYRIIYRLRPDEIEIATVMHYRQLLPEDLA